MKSISQFTTAAALLAAALSAQAAVLYDNGPVVGGSGLSVLTSPATTLGFGAQSSSGNAVADDFDVTAGQTWNISSINFYGYQTGSSSFTFQQAVWSVVSGDVNTGAVLASGVTSVSDGGLVGYRVTPTTLTSTQRGIYNTVADVPDFALSAGHYWLRWSLSGSLASGPWQPPTSDAATGNAAQSTEGGPFITLAEAGSLLSVTLPFTLNGTVTAVPEPASFVLALSAIGVAGFARRRRLKGG